MSIVWPKVKGADARCVGGAEAGPEGAIYDMVFEKGIVRLWLRVGGPDAERELGLEVPYQFFKDQLVVTDDRRQQDRRRFHLQGRQADALQSARRRMR